MASAGGCSAVAWSSNLVAAASTGYLICRRSSWRCHASADDGQGHSAPQKETNPDLSALESSSSTSSKKMTPAFEKAAAYMKKKKESSSSLVSDASVPDSSRTLMPAQEDNSATVVDKADQGHSAQQKNTSSDLSAVQSSSSTSSRKMIPAFEKVAAYMKKKKELVSDASVPDSNNTLMSAKEDSSASVMDKTDQDTSSRSLEVEIITRDGIIRRKVVKPDEALSRIKKPYVVRNKISSNDFMGLGFSEKKSKVQRPAGLAEGPAPPPPGDGLPQVEIITRDASAATELTKDSGVYKPKVATWGIFERPENISRTYGGGRNIKPGEQLETEDQKREREARTKQLLDIYRKKAGLDVDPDVKADSVKALKQGDELMEKGQMQSALKCYEKVMQQMPYQSELHGLAALQWSLCLDSLNRFEEARFMYEKIVSHPNISVRKQAKQLLFGFRAMDSLKVSTTSSWDTSPYRKYFNAFVDGYNTLYKSNPEDKESDNVQKFIFLYIGFLFSPIILLLCIILLRRK